MNKTIKNDKGLTLVELLASIVLLTIISVLIFSLITKAIETNRAVQVDTALRDEADIIVSKFIKTLYSTKRSDIVRMNGNTIEVTNDRTKCLKDADGWIIDNACIATLEPIGFKENGGMTTIYFKKEEYRVANKNIKILATSRVNEDPKAVSTYEIQLALEYTKKRGDTETKKQMDFKNQIQPILTTN